MKTLQIRHVPEEIHRALKVRAASEGVSLSDLALAELVRICERPTRAELLSRMSSRTIEPAKKSPTELLRIERDHA